MAKNSGRKTIKAVIDRLENDIKFRDLMKQLIDALNKKDVLWMKEQLLDMDLGDTGPGSNPKNSTD